MNKFVIDAYAWIEYFDGTKSGEEARKIIENPNNSISTSVITIAELLSHFRRKKQDFQEAKKVLSSLSAFYPINSEFAEEAGLLHADIKSKNRHFGLADTFVLLTAKKLNAKVLTGDEDFREIKEAILIKN